MKEEGQSMKECRGWRRRKRRKSRVLDIKFQVMVADSDNDTEISVREGGS